MVAENPCYKGCMKLTPHEVDELGEQVAKSAAVVDAATHEFLSRVRVFDEVSGWQQQGATSMAAWLGHRVGLTPGVAREKVRVSRALAQLPATDEALRLGQISYWKVRELSRVATAERRRSCSSMLHIQQALSLRKCAGCFGKHCAGTFRRIANHSGGCISAVLMMAWSD